MRKPRDLDPVRAGARPFSPLPCARTQLLLLCVAGPLIVGCGDDNVTGPFGSTGESTTGSSSDGDTTEGTDTTEGADTTSGTDTGEPEPAFCEAVAPPTVEYEPFRENGGLRLFGVPGASDTFIESAEEWAEICPQTAGAPGAQFQEDMTFWVYRPNDPMSPDPSGWPATGTAIDHAPVPLPVVFFAHAVGGLITDSLDDEEHYYDHIFDRLNEDGFVVVATTVGGLWEDKRAALQCAVEWAYTQWPEQEHLGCDVVFMGHSAGGGAAQAMVSYTQQNITDLNVRAAVGMSPVATAGPTLADSAVPYLLFQDPADDDPTAHAGIVYDGIVPEDPPADPPVFSPADKVLLWPFGTVDHFAWGGTPFEAPDPLMDPCDDPGQTMAAARTRALASSYVSAFLRWQVYGEMDQRRWFVDPTHYAAGVDAFVPAIADGAVLEDYWCTLYEDERFDELGERPVMLAAFAQGGGGGARPPPARGYHVAGRKSGRLRRSGS
jgi:acetyl esterase/lipase